MLSGNASAAANKSKAKTWRVVFKFHLLKLRRRVPQQNDSPLSKTVQSCLNGHRPCLFLMIVGLFEAVPVWGTTRVIRFSLNKKLSARLSCEKSEKQFASRRNSTDWACYF